MASFPLVYLLDILHLDPENEAQVDLRSSSLIAILSSYFHALINDLCRIVVAVHSPMRVDARSCINIFGTSDSKY